MVHSRFKSFQKNDTGWPPQPPTEKDAKIQPDIS